MLSTVAAVHSGIPLTMPETLDAVSRHVFNIKLSQLRASRRLTMDALAKLAKVSSATVYRAESKPPSSLRPLIVENLLCGLHESSPLHEDEVDELLALAGFTSAMGLQTKRRLLQISAPASSPASAPDEQDDSERQLTIMLLDLLMTRVPPKIVRQRVQQMVSEFNAKAETSRSDQLPAPPPGSVAIDSEIAGSPARVYHPSDPPRPSTPPHRTQQGAG